MIHEGGETLPDSEEFIETVRTQTNKAKKTQRPKEVHREEYSHLCVYI